MSRSFKRRRDEPVPASMDPETGSNEWVLDCSACGRQVVAEQADLDQYLTTGWPRCCGAEMRPSIRPIGD